MEPDNPQTIPVQGEMLQLTGLTALEDQSIWSKFLGPILVFLSFAMAVAGYIVLRIWAPESAAGPLDELVLILGGAVAALAQPVAARR
jgi:hypothetical protein